MIIMIVIVIVIGTWEADCFAKLGDFHRVPGTHQVYDAENYDDDEKEDNNDEKENNNDNDDDEKEDDDDDDDYDDTGLVWEGSQHRRCWSWCWEGWARVVIISIVSSPYSHWARSTTIAGWHKLWDFLTRKLDPKFVIIFAKCD